MGNMSSGSFLWAYDSLLRENIAKPGEFGMFITMGPGAGVECALCPVGTNCSGAATLDRLPIQPGYWRLDATTTDVRKCPDAAANCSPKAS